MQPRGTSLWHDTGALIDAYSQQELPADCREEWTVEHIAVALLQGPHLSDDAEEAMKAMHDETK